MDICRISFRISSRTNSRTNHRTYFRLLELCNRTKCLISTYILPRSSIAKTLVEWQSINVSTAISCQKKPRTQPPLILLHKGPRIPKTLLPWPWPQAPRRKSKERKLTASNFTNTQKILLAGFRSGKHRGTQVSLKLLLGNDIESNPAPIQADHNVVMQAFSYNGQGLGKEKKLRHLLNYFQQRMGGKNSDFICCLQETYIESPGKMPYLWRGNFQLTPGNGHSQGCITLLSPHLNIIANRSIESRGHVLACQKSGDYGETYIVANIYAPNPNSNEKIEFFNTVFDCIIEFQERYNCKLRYYLETST